MVQCIPSTFSKLIFRFALGQEDGTISIRDGENGEEYRIIKEDMPVWGLCFVYDDLKQSINESNVKITVGNFLGDICFYSLDGSKQGVTRKVKVFGILCTLGWFPGICYNEPFYDRALLYFGVWKSRQSCSHDQRWS